MSRVEKACTLKFWVKGIFLHLGGPRHKSIYPKPLPYNSWFEKSQLCLRGQETGDRRQESGGRRQETGDRSQGAGGRRQESGGRRQETEDRS